jgi:DNA invertase Pin-like site-specific DNA recombinase
MLPLRRADAAIAAGLAVAGLRGSLRSMGRRLGVSHETVRRTMIAAGRPTDLEARNTRIRAMAEGGVPWSAIAAAFGLSPSGVRRVCRDLPPRRAGPKPRGRPAVAT